MAYRLSDRASREVEEILAYSAQQFGSDAATRYGLLLKVAMEDVGNQPVVQGSQAVRRRPGVRVYEISHSRFMLPKPQRVQTPMHKLVYRPVSAGVVEILAVVGLSYPATRVAVPP